MACRKPTIVISKCLGFGRCRWDGEIIRDKFVDRLKSRVNFIAVCPEIGIGLGVPRDPIRIVFNNGMFKLKQIDTGKDLTRRMRSFSAKFLGSLGRVDGFILKDKSPSCGIRGVKAYSGLEETRVTRRTTGFFAQEVLSRFSDRVIESDARLSSSSKQKRFISRIFASIIGVCHLLL